jgi:hypothetical protein
VLGKLSFVSPVMSFGGLGKFGQFNLCCCCDPREIMEETALIGDVSHVNQHVSCACCFVIQLLITCWLQYSQLTLQVEVVV